MQTDLLLISRIWFPHVASWSADDARWHPISELPVSPCDFMCPPSRPEPKGHGGYSSPCSRSHLSVWKWPKSLKAGFTEPGVFLVCFLVFCGRCTTCKTALTVLCNFRGRRGGQNEPETSLVLLTFRIIKLINQCENVYNWSIIP